MFEVNASRIRELMFQKNCVGTYALAKQAKLNGATIKKCLQDGSKATLKTIGTLARFFGVNGEELILRKD